MPDKVQACGFVDQRRDSRVYGGNRRALHVRSLAAIDPMTPAATFLNQ